jgi:small subunit ribosomal protein S27Ae
MAEAKGAQKKEKKEPRLKSRLFEIKGDKADRKNIYCPKCGAGIFLAEHKDRQACGKCGYTQWKTVAKK